MSREASLWQTEDGMLRLTLPSSSWWEQDCMKSKSPAVRQNLNILKNKGGGNFHFEPPGVGVYNVFLAFIIMPILSFSRNFYF